MKWDQKYCHTRETNPLEKNIMDNTVSNDGHKNREAAREAGSAMREGLIDTRKSIEGAGRDIGSTARDVVKDIKSKTPEMLDSVVETGQQYLNDAMDKGRELVDSAQKGLESTQKNVESTIKDYPLTTLFGCLAAGYLVGRFAR